MAIKISGTEVIDDNRNITTSIGTVDGRDVATDGTKLDGIEAGAKADQTAAQLLTAIKTVDGSGSGLDADLLDGINSGSFLRSDVSDTVTNSTVTFDSSSRLTGSDAILDGFAMPQNPEGKHIKSPFFFNDIAYSRLRGATISVDVDGVAMTSTTNIDNMLNASGDFWNLSTAGKTTATITITNSPKALSWSSHMGLSFGNTNWRAKNITLEYSADNGTTWTLVKSLTNQPEEFVSGSWNAGSGVSASAFRWTLSNFNPGSMRVSSIFAYNYNSDGMKDLYVTRDGGSIYGNLAITGTVDGRDVATDGTKLDGIETGADVTDATNVSAAGALMLSGGTMTGAIDVTGTVTATAFAGDGSSLTGIGTDVSILTREPYSAVASNSTSVVATTAAGYAYYFVNAGPNASASSPHNMIFRNTGSQNLPTLVPTTGDYTLILNGNTYAATFTYVEHSFFSSIRFTTVPALTETSISTFAVGVPANNFTTVTALTSGVEYFTDAGSIFTGDGTSSYSVPNATSITNVYERYLPLVEGASVNYLDTLAGKIVPDFGYIDFTTALGTRYKQQNPSLYYTSGADSVDLSYSDSAPVPHVSGIVMTVDQKGASGAGSFAAGSNTVSAGYQSASFGSRTVASGSQSTAMGLDTIASGYQALAIGSYTMANQHWSTCTGINGSIGSNTYTMFGVAYAATGEENRSPNYGSDVNLVFKVNHTGTGFFDGSADAGNADYAEYFESFDGTPLERGYFVSFVEGSDCVSYGNENIVGIVSAAPAVVGDTQSLHYRGKYKKDEFETYIREPVIVTEDLVGVSVREHGSMWVLETGPIPEEAETFLITVKNTETQEVVDTITDETDLEPVYAYPYPVEVSASYTFTLIDKVLSPEFDEEQHYVPRSDRPEWSPIGLLGKLWVHLAAGEVIAVGDYITSDTSGKAVKCLRSDANSYRVISVNTEYNLVKVFYK